MEKRKDIHLEKSKSVLATILLCFIGLLAYSYDYLQVSPVEIYFNHEAGHTRDAVTISDDGTAIVNDPEWEDWCGEKHKFAYIKSQAKRSIKVRLSGGSYSGLMHLLIKVSYVSGHTDGIGTVCNLFVSNFNTDSLLTLYPTGDFPLSVGVHEFQWRWEIYAIPVNNSNYCAAWDTTYTSHHFYTLLAAPQAPVSEPWTSVLELACAWAASKTTEQQVLSSITINAYNYFGQTKQYSAGYTHTNGSTFYLSNFLSASFVDCMDMSAVVQVFTWMLGGSQTRVLYINNKIPGLEDFHYKKIKPIGSGWIENGLWNFHQVGWLNNVYDACIKLNYNNERIPVNEDVNGNYKIDLYLDYNSTYPWLPKTSDTFYFTNVQ